MSEAVTTPQGEQLYQKAIEFIYNPQKEGDKTHFESFIERASMLPEDKLPDLISYTVNDIIMAIENSNDKLGLELIIEVGFRLLGALIEDLSKALKDGELNKEVITKAAGLTISDYALLHPKTVSKQDLNAFLKELSKGQINLEKYEQESPQQQEPQEQQPMPQHGQGQGLLAGGR